MFKYEIYYDVSYEDTTMRFKTILFLSQSIERSGVVEAVEQKLIQSFPTAQRLSVVFWKGGPNGENN